MSKKSSRKRNAAPAKSRKKSNGRKARSIETQQLQVQTEPIPQPQSEPKPKTKAPMIIRAIRVTPELLAAAKAYKKVTGVSFYSLGLQAITERLIREGYLKEQIDPLTRTDA